MSAMKKSILGQRGGFGGDVEKDNQRVTPQEIGELVRHWREHDGLTVEERARQMGMGVRAYQDLEHGRGGAVELARWVVRIGATGREVRIRLVADI